MLKVSDPLEPADLISALTGHPRSPIEMKSSTESRKGRKTADDRMPESKEDEAKQIICFNCSHIISAESNKIEVSGKHAHFFTNPAGVSFDLRCFSEAPGCDTKGTPIQEFSWFPGYKWCFAFCLNCSVQSGWFYISPADHFFGLIRDAIIGG